MAEGGDRASLKRPFPEDGSREDDQKRARSHGDASGSSVRNGSDGRKLDVSKAVAEARARAAAAAERFKALKGGANGVSSHDQSARPGPGSETTIPSRPLSKIEEMRARVAALTNKNATSTAAPVPPPSFQPPQSMDDGLSRARGGLSAALHPSLLEIGKDAPARTSSQSNSKVGGNLKSQRKGGKAGKKGLDLSGPNLDEFKLSNPYFDASLGNQTATTKARNSKQLKFNEKGKYIRQAASLRRLEALEAMRKRIAASAKKALIVDDVAEKRFVVEAPPEIEWWDEGLVAHPEKGYSEVDDDLVDNDLSSANLKIESDDSLITRLIQHPVLITPPSDRLIPAPKAMYLTTQEQKKIRRQRRMAELKETQAKVRLGLMEPPPDKVKLGNLMRVLGEEAVKDPTAVEARVNRQIAERKATHEMQNEDRKLTKEQLHEKLEQKKDSDSAKGIYLQVYKINTLANGRHRFKISKNCEQLGGTGLCIFHPKFCLVLVEFGEHGAKNYRKLMLNRIDWHENSPSLPKAVREGNQAASNAFLEAEDENGQVKDLSGNRCRLLFEGEEKDRMFRKWTTKVCETDKEAIDSLTRSKMESFWTMARNTL